VGGRRGATYRDRALVDKPQEAPPASLAEERQQLTRSRIRRAAMEVVARRGFDATVEEIAEVSGVSPRTIFQATIEATTS
jgi:AcrR family transcriptional regulator